MRAKNSPLDPELVLARLVKNPALPPLSEAARVVARNRKLIRKAMRMGHGLETLSKELQLPKRALQRQLNEVGLFIRKPRTNRGNVVKRNLVAIARAKMIALANV
jgi:hypothetical protein